MKEKIYFIEKKFTIIVILLIGMFIGLLLDLKYATFITSVIAIIIELSWGEELLKSKQLKGGRNGRKRHI
jgi:hypothetical protein